jgi:hypothetical protein
MLVFLTVEKDPNFSLYARVRVNVPFYSDVGVDDRRASAESSTIVRSLDPVVVQGESMWGLGIQSKTLCRYH